ncbi:MAG: AAA family ATPase [Pseudomonadota bacterium]
MQLGSLVPASIWQASTSDREAYFDSVVTNHTKMKNALSRISEASSAFESQRLILLLGPAGVGKTALLECLIAQIFSQRKEKMTNDRLCVPGLFVELEPPVKGKFSFVPFYREALVLMNAAAIDKTLPISLKKPGRYQILSSTIDPKDFHVAGEHLKTRFRNNLIDRQVEVVALDEAIFAFEIASSRSHEERLEHVITQANHLRSFINKSPATFILAGAYDFFELTISTSQLARRSSIVHFESYASDADDIAGFSGALVELFKHLPLHQELDPNEYATELFLQSLGCVGILKDILKRALRLSFRRSKPIDHSLLRECFLSPPSLEAIRLELLSGSARLSKFLSQPELAERMVTQHPSEPKTQQPNRKLKPGEMKPSFRRKAIDQWDS